jgi:UDP-MurNAc hydroxylase
MKFTIISHACVDIQAASKRLVIDPWLFDPIYWGAWWHYPEPVFNESIFQADYIYLTHWHFDHFHLPTLSKFRKNCHVLVPKFPVSAFVDQLAQVGLTKVTELDHAKPFELAPGFEITSFQVQYQDDSVIAIKADETVIINLNDAKPMPSTWRLLKKRFPEVDFMLRSHSPAWSYPTCFTFDRKEDAIPVEKETYKIAFRQATEKLRPQYAIPFASGVCHLHRETIEENKFLVSGTEMKAYMDAHPIDGVTTVLMPFGSYWTSENGFTINPNQIPSVEEYVKKAIVERKDQLKEVYEVEDQKGLSYETFQKFFGKFIRGIKFMRPFLKIKWDFVIQKGTDVECWRVDFGKSEISKVPVDSTDCTSTITVHPVILADAIETLTFTNIDIAKRWKVRIRPGGLIKHLVMMGLIALFEAGYFNPKNITRQRAMTGLWRRFPEAVDYGILAFGLLRTGGQSMIEIVATPPEKPGKSLFHWERHA